MDSRDEELIALIARSALKDELAFKKLYRRVGAYLNGVAMRIVKSPEVSNDVLQEAFMQIWTNAASYRPHKAKPLTWMTSIVRYRALDRLDKEQRLLKRQLENESEINDFMDGNIPEQDASESQFMQHLNACLALLNEQSRQAITLAYVFGYSRVEIAAKLNSNASTVKSWLRRGAEKLRHCLKIRMGEKQ